MKQAVDARHGRLQRFAIGDVAGMHLDASALSMVARSGARTEGDNFVPRPITA